jgi:hypothetical protein
MRSEPGFFSEICWCQLEGASALLDDPNYWTQCRMMTAVWVRKPPV